MSAVTLQEENPVSLDWPPVGKFKIFISSLDGTLSKMDSGGAVVSISSGGEDAIVYDVAYSETGGDTSVYTFDLAGRTTPQEGKLVLLRFDNTNNYSPIDIVVAGLGTYSLKKVNTVDFAMNELENGQIIGVVFDGSDAFFMAGFSDENTISTTVSALKTLITTNALIPNFFYEFSWQTQYTYDGAPVTSGNIETFQVYAIGDNRIAHEIKSIQYKNDIIELDLFDPTFGEKIIKRIDPIKNLDAPFDWRAVKFRRGLDDITGEYIIVDPASTEFTGSSLDVYAFDNLVDGGTCRNIKILETQLNALNTNISALDQYNLLDSNNVFIKCQNMVVDGGCYFNSFLQEDDLTASNNPAVKGVSTVSGTSMSIVKNFSQIDIKNSKSLSIFGDLVLTNEFYSIYNVLIDACDTLKLEGDVWDAKLSRVSNTSIKDSNNLNFNGLANSFISVAVRATIAGVDGTSIDQCNDINLVRIGNAHLFRANDATLSNSSNFTLIGANRCSLSNLDQPYQKEILAGTIVADVTILSSITVTVDIPSAVFNNGDVILVNNPGLLVFDRTVLVNFDTNSDLIPDTGNFGIFTAGFTEYYAIGDPFYLIYDSVLAGFYLLNPSMKAPYVISSDDQFFNGIDGNMETTILLLGSTLVIADTEYDFAHIKHINIDHSNGATIDTIANGNNKYDKMERFISSGDVGETLDIDDGVAAGRIYLPTSVTGPITLDDNEDYIKLLKKSGRWIVTDNNVY